VVETWRMPWEYPKGCFWAIQLLLDRL
jgi:hypothetical protein